jgi:hypothetical protein
MPKSESSAGKYIYCITRSSEPRQFMTPGIGEQGDIVYTISFRNIAAVISDSPAADYESSRRNLMAHTLVLEEVMREFVILPVRFGTVAPDEETIREKVLKRRYGELIGLLNEMKDQVELGLKAFWYEDIIFHEIVEETPSIRALRDSLTGRTPEETYYERIRLGEMIESVMWDKRLEDSEKILSQLRPLAYKIRANKVITDRMILNAAFLVERDRQAAFDEAVKKIDEDMGKRLALKYVGPVPPYNFVDIVVQWDEEEVPHGVSL